MAKRWTLELERLEKEHERLAKELRTALKPNAATSPGVDGATWQEYAAGLKALINDILVQKREVLWKIGGEEWKAWEGQCARSAILNQSGHNRVRVRPG